MNKVYTAWRTINADKTSKGARALDRAVRRIIFRVVFALALVNFAQQCYSGSMGKEKKPIQPTSELRDNVGKLLLDDATPPNGGD